MTSRRVFLTAAFLALVPGFLGTQALVALRRNNRQQLAVEWSTRGQRDLASQHPADAIVDFRTALAYAPDDPDLRLHLARALIAVGRLTEAEAHLLTLWADAPGEGAINLELGRLAAANNNLDDTLRYYHAAIDGAWTDNPMEARRRARTELAAVLLKAGDKNRALAELIALADDLPADAEALTGAAQLLMQAGADNRSVPLLGRALTIDPSNTRALRLLGEAEFKTNGFSDARRWLTEVRAKGSLDPAGADMLALSDDVLTLDPYARGMTARERAARALRAYGIARDRLARCADSASPIDAGSASQVSALGTRMRDAAAQAIERTLEQNPDELDEVTALAFDVEALPDSACGPLTEDDRALQLVARLRRAGGR